MHVLVHVESRQDALGSEQESGRAVALAPQEAAFDGGSNEVRAIVACRVDRRLLRLLLLRLLLLRRRLLGLWLLGLLLLRRRRRRRLCCGAWVRELSKLGHAEVSVRRAARRGCERAAESDGDGDAAT